MYKIEKENNKYSRQVKNKTSTIKFVALYIMALDVIKKRLILYNNVLQIQNKNGDGISI